MEYLLIFTSYLLGSIPFGLVLTKAFGVGDIRNMGSGNIGATNVLRTGNKWLALATLVLDAAKGFVAVYLCKFFASDVVFLGGFLAIMGHIYPLWLKLKGGKGVATTLGVYLALDYKIGLILALIWFIVARLFRISSLSALIAVSLLPFFVLFFQHAEGKKFSWFVTSFATALLILWTHRSNIKRLIKGEEKTIKL